jgi:hypothetical protein
MGVAAGVVSETLDTLSEGTELSHSARIDSIGRVSICSVSICVVSIGMPQSYQIGVGWGQEKDRKF